MKLPELAEEVSFESRQVCQLKLNRSRWRAPSRKGYFYFAMLRVADHPGPSGIAPIGQFINTCSFTALLLFLAEYRKSRFFLFHKSIPVSSLLQPEVFSTLEKFWCVGVLPCSFERNNQLLDMLFRHPGSMYT